MARAKSEVLHRMATIGMRAHVLYQVEVQLRDAAESLEAIGENDDAAALRTEAQTLGWKRRREVAKHKRESAGKEGK